MTAGPSTADPTDPTRAGGAAAPADAAAVLRMEARAAAALLDRLADRGWPAEHRERHGGWTLRAADGVTRRANSVLPAGPVTDPEAALDRTEAFARAHGIDACLQLSPASEPAGLAALLAERGYVPEARTVVQVADAVAVASALDGSAPADPALRVDVADAPDAAWLDAWWSVDGRGGSAEAAVARRILTRGPALYAAVRERRRDDEDHEGHEARDPEAGGRVLATARLALVDGWGGLYAVATRPEARRRGLSRAAVDAVVHVGIDRGVTALWLQVLADNDAARALYASLGFAPASRYEYWARPGDR